MRDQDEIARALNTELAESTDAELAQEGRNAIEQDRQDWERFREARIAKGLPDPGGAQ